MTHDMYNSLINLGSMVALILGLGVIVSLGLGVPVKLVPAPVRRKR
jgi:hypothetical protein